MKPAEIRDMTTDEIRAELADARQELMNLRFRLAIGGLTDHTRLSYTRRNIARLQTILREREMAATEEGEA